MALKLTIPLPPHFLEYPGEPKVRWSNWISQLENFFTLTNLTLPKESQLSDHAKNAYLASLLGTEGARILMAHPMAKTAEKQTFKDFSDKVATLFERPVNAVRAEFEFRSRRQSAGESAAEFLTALRTLISDCDTLSSDADEARKIQEHNLAMQLAIGCYARRTQEKLLQQRTVDLDSFFRIMQADESAAETSSVIRNDTPQHIATASSNQQHHQHSRRTPHNGSNCLGCGRTGHRIKARECPALGKTCNLCRKTNHFASQCLSKKRTAVQTLRLGNVREPSTAPPPCSLSLLVECES